MYIIYIYACVHMYVHIFLSLQNICGYSREIKILLNIFRIFEIVHLFYECDCNNF